MTNYEATKQYRSRDERVQSEAKDSVEAEEYAAMLAAAMAVPS